MKVGIGYIDTNTSSKYTIKVSDLLDYEISFLFKQSTNQPIMEISVNIFSCDLKTEIKPIDIRSGAFNNVLLPGNVKICSVLQKWNFWHGVIYNKNQPLVTTEDPITSHAAGTNLIMRPGSAKMFVNVICTSGCLQLWDFKVKPLKTPFATGFLGASGMLEIFRRNNKKDLSEEQIDSIADKFLLPKETPGSVINI